MTELANQLAYLYCSYSASSTSCLAMLSSIFLRPPTFAPSSLFASNAMLSGDLCKLRKYDR